MSDEPLKEHVPTPEEVEREARRLARVRHLTLVHDGAGAPVVPLAERFREPDPEPRPAA
jgi:hypothetical protein